MGTMEQRRHRRLNTNLRLRYLTSQYAAVKGRVVNISEGGLFIEMKSISIPRSNNHVEFEIELPDRRLLLSGIVRWSANGSEMCPAGCGIEFLNMDRRDLESLKRFVSS